MKRFDAELFKQTLMQTPWDSVFIFDETDDVLDSWEKLSIDGLEQHCPWRTKRVAWVNQAPWITPAVIKQLQFRDAFLKKFRRHRNPSVWADYKKARNKEVGMLRNIKRKFYVSKLEQNENDTKGTLFDLDNDLNLTAKAFDMVDQVILQDKLYAYGLDNTSLT